MRIQSTTRKNTEPKFNLLAEAETKHRLSNRKGFEKVTTNSKWELHMSGSLSPNSRVTYDVKCTELQKESYILTNPSASLHFLQSPLPVQQSQILTWCYWICAQVKSQNLLLHAPQLLRAGFYSTAKNLPLFALCGRAIHTQRFPSLCISSVFST